MRVWEEDWVFDGRWLKVAPAHGEVYGNTFACCDYANDDDANARIRLAAAAPSMARLLRALCAEHGSRARFDWAYWSEEIEAELMRAGIPLPEEPVLKEST